MRESLTGGDVDWTRKTCVLRTFSPSWMLHSPSLKREMLALPSGRPRMSEIPLARSGAALAPPPRLVSPLGECAITAAERTCACSCRHPHGASLLAEHPEGSSQLDRALKLPQKAVQRAHRTNDRADERPCDARTLPRNAAAQSFRAKHGNAQSSPQAPARAHRSVSAPLTPVRTRDHRSSAHGLYPRAVPRRLSRNSWGRL